MSFKLLEQLSLPGDPAKPNEDSFASLDPLLRPMPVNHADRQETTFETAIHAQMICHVHIASKIAQGGLVFVHLPVATPIGARAPN